MRGLRKFFPIAKGIFRRVTGHVRAVDDVSFTVQEGETLGLVGESGCGKTTASRCILRAIDPTDGQVLYRTRDNEIVDLAPMSRAELAPLRRDIQMIFQDPFGSLNPYIVCVVLVLVGGFLVYDALSPSRRLRQGGSRWAAGSSRWSSASRLLVLARDSRDRHPAREAG